MRFDAYKLPPHLPERLTISFPIWGLIDTAPDGAYHDLAKMVAEHVERGFNCIRLDDGAGLAHDRSGTPRGKIRIAPAFGEYSYTMRQFDCCGNRGYGSCDVLERLTGLAEEAKKQHVFLILSSWFFLHVFWFWKDEKAMDGLFSIPPQERFQAFAEFLDFILCELEKRGLDSVIAFAEIFNEADGLPFFSDYNRSKTTAEEKRNFRNAHAEAIGFVRSRHPQILFAYDTWTPWTDTELIPANADLWNFHNYYTWSIYSDFEKTDFCRQCFKENASTLEDVIHSRKGLREITADWFPRVHTYSNLDPAKFPVIEKWFNDNFEKNYDSYRTRFDESLEAAVSNARTYFPGKPVVCGEGVSYSGAKNLVWEEKNAAYWELVGYAMNAYRKAGMWGTVIRTCCGPEDPCWTMCPDILKRLNENFLKGE